MKRRRSISCDILLAAVADKEESDVIKRLKPAEDAAAAADDDNVAEDQTPAPPNGTTAPVYTYFNKHNRFIEIDWTERFAEDLPTKLLEILEGAKEPSAVNRYDIMPAGTVPYFALTHGLVPKKTWDQELRVFLIANPSACLVSPKDATLNYLLVQKAPQMPPKPQPPPTNDQTQLIDRIEYFMREPYANFHVISLQGAAGTGKTFVLSQFGQKATYITTTKLLCNDVRLKYGVETSTLCKFLMEQFDLPFASIRLLQDLTKHVPHDSFAGKGGVGTLATVECRAFRWKRALRKLKRLSRFVNRGTCERLYFLDEFSLMSCGTIGLVIEILRLHALYSNDRIVLVIAGDRNQIPPLFAVPTHSLDFVEQSADYSFMFSQQMRCLDDNYTKILNRVLRERDLRSYIRTTFAHIDGAAVEYNYPISLVQQAPTEIDPLIAWIADNNILDIVSLIFFSFTNRELHFNNISMGVAIWRQLELYKIQDIHSYVQFQILASKSDRVEKKFSYKFPLETESRGPVTPYILPLVKFFPYKILTREIETLPRSSIVVLLAWNDSRAIVLDPRDNSIHALGPSTFRMNLHRHNTYRGFPLQLHVGETSFSCQGMTITRGICVNASNATRQELYVTLSRVQSLNKCIRVHVP